MFSKNKQDGSNQKSFNFLKEIEKNIKLIKKKIKLPRTQNTISYKTKNRCFYTVHFLFIVDFSFKTFHYCREFVFFLFSYQQINL